MNLNKYQRELYLEVTGSERRIVCIHVLVQPLVDDLVKIIREQDKMIKSLESLDKSPEAESAKL